MKNLGMFFFNFSPPYFSLNFKSVKRRFTENDWVLPHFCQDLLGNAPRGSWRQSKFLEGTWDMMLFFFIIVILITLHLTIKLLAKLKIL
jgi:hypothetical protein